jgi:triacylglycerol esterase/lipase EstA (alpha/beta hydrolase family)
MPDVATLSTNPSRPAVETVLLLHGLGRTSRSMASLGRCLKRQGYSIIDWGYKSFKEDIEAHSTRLCATLAKMSDDPTVSKIHLVTHSLGGIITRHALSETVPSKMGRVVMLAPPNRGSRVARRLTPVLGRVMKPLSQLSDHPESVVNQLAVPQAVEIGIIAAARDGKVRVEDTHLPGETDHVVMLGYHTFIMNRTDVQNQVVAFIREGRFSK